MESRRVFLRSSKKYPFSGHKKLVEKASRSVPSPCQSRGRIGKVGWDFLMVSTIRKTVHDLGGGFIF